MSTTRTPRRTRKASESRLLQEDVAAMVRDQREGRNMHQNSTDLELAHDIVLVVRERVLQEIQSYARENIR